MKAVIRSGVMVFLMLAGCLKAAFAWDSFGHRVVAVIAYQHLTPNAKSWVNHITEHGDKHYSALARIQYGAMWPDFLKGKGVTQYNGWHFVDLPDVLPGGKAPVHVPKENAIWAVLHCVDILKNKQSSAKDQLFALRFLLHVTADITQPLHTTSLYSREFPNGDRGGNFYPIRMGKIKYLHPLWDQGLGLLKYKRKRITKQVLQLSDQIQQKFPQNHFAVKQLLFNPVSWAQQSHQMAVNFAYKTPENQRPNQQYLDKGRIIVMQQLALAGYRLARLLNSIANTVKY